MTGRLLCLLGRHAWRPIGTAQRGLSTGRLDACVRPGCWPRRRRVVL